MRFLLTFILVPVLLLTVTFSSIVIALNAGTLKASLSKSGLYDAASDFLNVQVAKLPGGAQLAKALKPEAVSSYLQKKIEEFTDRTFAYLSGETDKAPSVTLTDMAQSLSLPTALKPLLSQLPQSLGLPVNVAENLETWYGWLKLVPLPLLALSVLLLLMLFLSGKDWPHRAKLAGKAFLFAAIPGLILFLLLIFLLPRLTTLQIPNFPSEVSFLQEPLLAFVAAFLQKINLYQGIVYIVLLALGILGCKYKGAGQD